MKTIFRILMILSIGILLSGALYLAIENTDLASSISGSGGEPPAMSDTTTTTDTAQPSAPPEGGGDHDSASFTRGLSEISVSLAKISGITILVLLFQAIITRLRKRRTVKPALG